MKLNLKVKIRVVRCLVSGTLAVFASGVAQAAALAPAVVTAQVATIESLFTAGDYQTATRDANKLLAHDQELPVSLRLRLYLVKARLEVAFARMDELYLWLGKAQLLDPGLSFDPVKDPPALLAVWRELKLDLRGASKKEGDYSHGRRSRPSVEPSP